MGDYVGLVVFATAIGIVGGALGSGVESRDAVRRVAFGVGERHRRDEAPAEAGRTCRAARPEPAA